MPTTKKVEPRTPQRDVIASTINYYRGTNGRVSAAGWEQVKKDLKDSNIMMSLNGVKKIGYQWWKQKKAGVPVTQNSVSRKRKEKCGRPTVLTPDIARRMMAIQAEKFGKLSYRRLCIDGKIGIWPFTVERVAKRSSRTGNVAGVTMILEDVKVDAVEYRRRSP